MIYFCVRGNSVVYFFILLGALFNSVYQIQSNDEEEIEKCKNQIITACDGSEVIDHCVAAFFLNNFKDQFQMKNTYISDFYFFLLNNIQCSVDRELSIPVEWCLYFHLRNNNTFLLDIPYEDSENHSQILTEPELINNEVQHCKNVILSKGIPDMMIDDIFKYLYINYNKKKFESNEEDYPEDSNIYEDYPENSNIYDEIIPILYINSFVKSHYCFSSNILGIEDFCRIAVPKLKRSKAQKKFDQGIISFRNNFDKNEEIPKLNEWFAKNPTPNIKQIRKYVTELNKQIYRKRHLQLDIYNVMGWFRNQRKLTNWVEEVEIEPDSPSHIASGSESKQYRTRVTYHKEYEVPLLMKWFEENPQPNYTQILNYTNELNNTSHRKKIKPLTTRNVARWFSNARATRNKRNSLTG